MGSQILIHNLGYPRMGALRQLKKSLEAYWRGSLLEADLHQHVDLALGDPALVGDLHARPAIAPAAHDLAATHTIKLLSGAIDQ